MRSLDGARAESDHSERDAVLASRGLSLRWRLILLVVAGVIPFLVFILGYQYVEYLRDVDATGLRTLALARSMALLVDEELLSRIAALQALATSRALVEPDLVTFRLKAEEVIAQQFPGANILLVRQDGQQIFNTLVPPGAPLTVLADMESTRRVFITGRPGVSNLFRRTVRSRAVVAIDVPVVGTDGKVVYVLSLNPVLDGFADVIRREQLPATWLTGVTDRSGVAVARVPNGALYVGQEAAPNALAHLLTEREGVIESVSREGVPILAVFSHGDRFGWAVAIGVPRIELTGPALSRALRTLMAAGLVLGSGLVLALYAARGIAGPIESLQRLAAANDGNAALDLAPTGLREVDEVARALSAAEEGRRRSRHAEVILRDGIETISEGFVIYDDDDRLVMCNDSYRRLYGDISDTIVSGGGFADLWRARLTRGNYPNAKGCEEAWIADRVRELRQLDDGVEQQLDGGQWILVRNRRLSNGWIAGLRIDITARRAMEKDLRASEDRFRSIFSAVGEGIFIVSPSNGAFTEINEAGCAMFGYAADELIGSDLQTLSSGIAPYTQWEAAERIERAATSNHPQRFSWHCRAKDGHLFWTEISTRSALISGQKAVLAIVRDVTEQISVEAQLLQSQKMEAIGNLSGGMAHDFNNMLGVIIGSLDLAVPLVKDNYDVAELVREAIDAALSSAELTSRLLAFARKQTLRPQRIAPNDLISGIARLLRRTLGENIEIVLDLADDLWPVIADSAQLEASLTNLATNARDAMPNGGTLSIATVNRCLDTDYVATNVEAAAGDYAAIEVSDTGTGMISEIAQRIFEPFYTTKDAGKGTGLGLSMVYGFIKQSGGHINVYSEPGFGTTFRLYLPRVEAETGRTAAASRPAPPVRGAGESVLVVEDNPRLRQVVMRQLRELRYQPIEADGSAAALAILEREKIGLLFTDVIMPGPLDGIGLARQVIERWSTVKVVLTSGFAGRKFDDLVDARGAAVCLIGKPYRVEELAKVLRKAFDG